MHCPVVGRQQCSGVSCHHCGACRFIQPFLIIALAVIAAFFLIHSIAWVCAGHMFCSLGRMGVGRKAGGRKQPKPVAEGTPIKSKRSSDVHDDVLGELGQNTINEARQELDKILDQKPNLTFHLLSLARKGDASKMAEGSKEKQVKSHWHGTQVRMQVIPKYWIEAYLSDLVPDCDTFAEKLSTKANNMREWFYGSHNLYPGTLLPTAAHEKVLFDKMLRVRYKQCGSMLSDLKTMAQQYGPDYHFQDIPLFAEIVDKGMVVAITHLQKFDLPEVERLPAGGVWKLRWSHDDAFYKMGLKTLFMKDLFDFSELEPTKCEAGGDFGSCTGDR